ncbi:MAG: hypothetical protein JXR48_12185 [Candidatus Delongbacteria bacterium]|nr:hypothetical protein [Candidatus Delongbacteria bacterium]MBN2835711.1 hypothetical protein [Candidatus Delongbacteria bacterium]
MKSLIIALKSVSLKNYLALTFYIILMMLPSLIQNEYTNYFIIIFPSILLLSASSLISNTEKNLIILSLPNSEKIFRFVRIITMIILSAIILIYIYQADISFSSNQSYYLYSFLLFCYFCLFGNFFSMFFYERLLLPLIFTISILWYFLIDNKYQLYILIPLNIFFLLYPFLSRFFKKLKPLDEGKDLSIINLFSGLLSFSRNRKLNYTKILIFPALKGVVAIVLSFSAFYTISVLLQTKESEFNSSFFTSFLVYISAVFGSPFIISRSKLLFLTFNISREKFTKLIIVSTFVYSLISTFIMLGISSIPKITMISDITNLGYYSIVFFLICSIIVMSWFIVTQSFKNFISSLILFIITIIFTTISLKFYNNLVTLTLLTVIVILCFYKYKSKILNYDFN